LGYSPILQKKEDFMAFKLTQTPRFKAKVTVNLPNEKGGFDENSFEAFFKRVTSTEAEELRKVPGTPSENAHTIARKVLVGWELTDADTQEVVLFSQEAADALLEAVPNAAMAIALAFWESLNGARSKN
jgi:Phage tail assembly chaperone